MANNSTVRGSVTLRKLRTGATATITLSSSMQLFQLYTLNQFGNILPAPDWTDASNHPVVTVNAVTNQGKITIQGVVWRIDGVVVGLNPVDSPGITANQTGGVFSLDINANLVDASHTNSRTLTAEITFQDDSGHLTTVEKSEIIRIQQAVENGYYVMIDADRTWVDERSNTDTAWRAHLTAKCYKGVSPMTSGITYKWFNTTATGATEIGTGATLSVKADDIDGSQLFICRAYDGGNNEVDAESITIVDNSDTYIIVATAQQYQGSTAQGAAQPNVTSVNVASDNDKTTLTFKVATQMGVDYTGTPTSWEAWKYHADTMKLVGQVAGTDHTNDVTTENSYNHFTMSAAKTISVDVLDADYISVGSTNVDAHDTEVIVTAQANL